MKISVGDFELRMVPFLKQVLGTMPSSLHKWVGGIIIAKSAGRIENLVKTVAGADGMVDLDELKKLSDAGFEASGGELVMTVGDESLSMFGLRPVNVKLTKADVDGLLSDMARQ